MIVWIALLSVVIMLVAAMAVLLLPNLLGAVVASSVVSLALSVLFAILQAPDVALTEAAVGAGLSSVLLVLAIRRMGGWQQELNETKPIKETEQ
jgi:energy-converting hydrogenase B subunit D